MTTENYALLSKAIKEDDLESVFRLVKQGCEVAKIDDETGLNYLHLAVIENRYKIVENIVKDEYIDNPCKKCTLRRGRGYTPLHLSCLIGNEEISDLLLCKGASVRFKADDGCTPLHVAVEKEHPKIVHLLLRCDPTCVNCEDFLGRTGLHFTVDNVDTEVINLLLEYGADVKHCSEGMTVLHKASINGNATIVEYLMRNTKNLVNCTEICHDRTALHFAVDKGEVNIVKLLLNIDEILDVFNQHKVHSRDQNLMNPHDMPINISACKTCSSKIQFLKESSADVNLITSLDHTALYFAVKNNSLKMVRLLLKHRADVRIYVNRSSVLSIATECGFIEIVEELLKSGASIDLSALSIACKNNKVDVLKRFVNHGWELDNESVHELIYDAISRYAFDIVQLLFNSGVCIKYLHDNYNINFPINIYKYIRYFVSWWDKNIPYYVGSGPNNECLLGFIHVTNFVDIKWFDEKFPAIDMSRFTAHEFLDHCNKEVEWMKNKRLGSSNISLLELFEMDLGDLVKCLKNVDLVNALYKEYSFPELPICGDILRITFDKGLQRRMLMDQCVEYFRCVYSGCPTLLPKVVEMIVGMLANRDLNAFAFACNSLI